MVSLSLSTFSGFSLRPSSARQLQCYSGDLVLPIMHTGSLWCLRKDFLVSQGMLTDYCIQRSTANTVCSCICVSTAIHYATSSYRDLAGELITTIILIRNTLSFALNYGITPWVTAEGTRNTMITVAAIAFVWNGSMFVMIKYGRRLRENSAKRYWTWVEQAKAKGLYAAH